MIALSDRRKDVLRVRSRGRTVRRLGLGLVVGVVGGWLAGLLRAPEPAPAAPPSATDTER